MVDAMKNILPLKHAIVLCWVIVEGKPKTFEKKAFISSDKGIIMKLELHGLYSGAENVTFRLVVCAIDSFKYRNWNNHKKVQNIWLI